MSKTKIKSYLFNKSEIENLKQNKFGMNWPVVYILNNDKKAYIGESANAIQRMQNHLTNKGRLNKYKNFHLICDETFNKSAIEDIESLLIDYMNADQKYKLDNIKPGKSKAHNYYQKQYYIDKFDGIWKILKKNKLVDHQLTTIRNSDIFKYSPYKTLTEDQEETAHSIFNALLYQYERKINTTFIVNGGAGTGKTILAIYLIKTISNIMNNNYNMEDLEELAEDGFYEDGYLDALLKLKSEKQFKIALVVPMQSFRKTLKKVFASVKGLKASMVIGPSEVVNKEYDLLVVDEAHRLRRKVNLMPGLHNTFKKNNNLLNLHENSTELDWILASSSFQILFYDKNQSVKPSDVRRDDFKNINKYRNVDEFNLTTQLRVKGGADYIKYVGELLSGKAKKKDIKDYDLQMFNDLGQMLDQIKEMDKQFGLCRNVAGYSWKWKTKGKTYIECVHEKLFDIKIKDISLIWNTTDKDWVNSKNALEEIGCIHTIQGYDLNYTGIIFGNEISYDDANKKIIFNKDNYFDINGKKGIDNEKELHDYIINIYKVMMTRGILGTYIYVCDEKLRKYLSNLLKVN